MTFVDKIKVIIGSGVTHVAFAFIVMGGWAVFANRAHGLVDMALAGLVQGALSATITLLMKKAIDYLSALFFQRDEITAALVAPPLVVCSVSLTGLVVSHLIAGTPELLATIAIPFSVAFTYAWVYCFGIWKHRRATP